MVIKILIVLLVLLLSGCVSNKYTEMTDLCKPHGGVLHTYARNNQIVSGYCMDGTWKSTEH